MAYRKSNQGLTLRFFLLHPAVWFLVATCLLIFSSKILWEKNKEKLIGEDQFIVSESDLRVSRPPEWFAEMLNEEIDHFLANRLSLLKSDLVPNALSYFESVPWVQRVMRIEKTPDGLDIDMNYREPVALVNLKNRLPMTVDSEGKLFATSVLSKTELAQFENDLMRIYIFRPIVSPVAAWHYFPDKRIHEGAALVEFVQQRASDFELYYAVSEDLPPGKGYRKSHWELWTKNGTRVIWGSAPGLESQSEAKSRKKLSALSEFVANYGKLPEFDDKDQMKIDISHGKAVLVKATRTAESDTWLQAIK